jgi:prefoldin beta subunit
MAAIQVDAALKRFYEQMQAHIATMKETQGKKSKHIESRQKLGSQKNENELVCKELKNLEEGSAVYKLIGPVLVSQDSSDAHVIVEKRLEFINKELARVDKHIAECEKEEDTLRAAVQDIQNKMQAIAQKQQEDAAKQQQAAQ